MRIKYYIVPLFVASCLLMCACSGKRAFVRKMEGQNLTAGLSQPGKTVDTTVVDVPREVKFKENGKEAYISVAKIRTAVTSPVIHCLKSACSQRTRPYPNVTVK